MILKKLCTEFAIFESDDPNKDFENILLENTEQYPNGPCNDDAEQPAESAINKIGKKSKKRNQGNNVRDLITAVAICNNVTPVLDDPDIEHALDVYNGDKNKGVHKSTIPKDEKSSLIEVKSENRRSGLGVKKSHDGRLTGRQSEQKTVL